MNSESASYSAFRNFIETGNPELNETSVELLSNATKYELASFNSLEAERNTTSGTETIGDLNSLFTYIGECVPR